MIKKTFAILLFVFVIGSAFMLTAYAEVEIAPTELPSEYFNHQPVFDSAMRYEMLFLLAIVVLSYLETLFSNKENKYMGLILPAVSLLAMTVVTIVFTLRAEAFTIYGFVFTFILLNIPTAILYAIYHFCRKKYEKEKK
ncbi:MAG: hypothetical protein IJ435_01850 [Clostridia bacterium]|nr:hypothetical protein [Clostridia bacterium]